MLPNPEFLKVCFQANNVGILKIYLLVKLWEGVICEASSSLVGDARNYCQLLLDTLTI